jgi:HlyD family secretion protein
MKRWLVRILILAFLASAALGLRSWVLRPQPIEVVTVVVDRGTVEQTITNTRAGTIKAHRRTRLSPEIGGNAIEIPYRESDAVKKGELLLRLDDRLQLARLTLSENNLRTIEARQNEACLRSERAAREHDRILRLSQEKIVSDDIADETKAAAATAEAGCSAATSAVEHAASAVNLSRVELQKMIIVAPFDGIVADVSIEVGEWTSPSPPALPIPPVIDLIDPTSIYVSAPMDEVDSAQIHQGQQVRVTVDSHRGQEFPGTVQRVAIYVLDLEAQNRTVEIDVELADNPFASTLRPGTTADVEVILQVKERVLRIPTGALYDGNKVLVVDGGLLAERELELGLKNWNYTEVLSGLEQGESLVTTLDRPEIKAGALVSNRDEESVSPRATS